MDSRCAYFSFSLLRLHSYQLDRFGRRTANVVEDFDPRPDILPRPIYDHHTAYRAQYNRPSFVVVGSLTTSREPASKRCRGKKLLAGNYAQHHMPPVYKTYYYPKPWEVLNTASRPDFPSNRAKTQPVAAADESLKADESSRTQNVQAEADSDDKVKAAKDFVPSPSDKGE